MDADDDAVGRLRILEAGEGARLVSKHCKIGESRILVVLEVLLVYVLLVDGVLLTYAESARIVTTETGAGIGGGTIGGGGRLRQASLLRDAGVTRLLPVAEELLFAAWR